MSPPTPGHDMVTSILASEAVLGLSQNPAHACVSSSSNKAFRDFNVKANYERTLFGMFT